MLTYHAFIDNPTLGNNLLITVPWFDTIRYKMSSWECRYVCRVDLLVDCGSAVIAEYRSEYIETMHRSSVTGFDSYDHWMSTSSILNAIYFIFQKSRASECKKRIQKFEFNSRYQSSLRWASLKHVRFRCVWQPCAWALSYYKIIFLTKFSTYLIRLNHSRSRGVCTIVCITGSNKTNPTASTGKQQYNLNQKSVGHVENYCRVRLTFRDNTSSGL